MNMDTLFSALGGNAYGSHGESLVIPEGSDREVLEEGPPAHAYLLNLFEEQLRSIVKMQRAFRAFRDANKYANKPSDLNPAHWKHWIEFRKTTGWAKQELLDEFGRRRVRTDMIFTRSKQEMSRLLNPIRNGKNLSCMQLQQDEAAEQLSAALSRLADQWHRHRQEEMKKVLRKEPFRDIFQPGSEEHRHLMALVLQHRVHQTSSIMHAAHVHDLMASVQFTDDKSRDKFCGLLSQFRDVLITQQHVGAEHRRPARTAISVYDWVIRDAGSEFKNTLENCRRYASTPPPAPEGLPQDVYDLYKEVCASVAASPYRLCHLRRTGRKWVQVFEKSSQKRRRLIRTHSSGNLGLQGPPSVDASSARAILPLTGEPPTAELSEAHKIFYHLQTIVEAQKKQHNRGRDVRPLRCPNTEWMGGVDWARIGAIATGQPLPTGFRAAPLPTDEELDDMFEDVLQSNTDEVSKGFQNQYGAAQTADAAVPPNNQDQLHQREEQQAGQQEAQLPIQQAVELIPFDAQNRYLEEVHDLLQENGMAGMTCQAVIELLMRAARAPTTLPLLDAAAQAQLVDACLCEADARTDIQSPGRSLRITSAGQEHALQQVTMRLGVRVHRRTLSAMEPNELGLRIQRAMENPQLLCQDTDKSPGSSTAPQPPLPPSHPPETTWPMLLRAWRAGGLPGWRPQDGQSLAGWQGSGSKTQSLLNRISILRAQKQHPPHRNTKQAGQCSSSVSGGSTLPSKSRFFPVPAQPRQGSEAQQDQTSSSHGGESRGGKAGGPAGAGKSMSELRDWGGRGLEPSSCPSRSQQHSEGGARLQGWSELQRGGSRLLPSSSLARSSMEETTGTAGGRAQPAEGKGLIGAYGRDRRRSMHVTSGLEQGRLFWVNADSICGINGAGDRQLSRDVVGAQHTRDRQQWSMDAISSSERGRNLRPSMGQDGSYGGNRGRQQSVDAISSGERGRDWRPCHDASGAAERGRDRQWSVDMSGGVELTGNRWRSVDAISRFQQDGTACNPHTYLERRHSVHVPGNNLQSESGANLPMERKPSPSPDKQAGCDMLLLLLGRGHAYWAVIAADAYALQLLAMDIAHKPKGSKRRVVPIPTFQSLGRCLTVETEKALLLQYLEHYLQAQARENVMQVSHIEPLSFTPTSLKSLQLDYCRLVKSEVYKRLNRYLVIGLAPSSEALQPAILQQRPSKALLPQSQQQKQQQQQQQQAQSQTAASTTANLPPNYCPVFPTHASEVSARAGLKISPTLNMDAAPSCEEEVPMGSIYAGGHVLGTSTTTSCTLNTPFHPWARSTSLCGVQPDASFHPGSALSQGREGIAAPTGSVNHTMHPQLPQFEDLFRPTPTVEIAPRPYRASDSNVALGSKPLRARSIAAGCSVAPALQLGMSSSHASNPLQHRPQQQQPAPPTSQQHLQLHRPSPPLLQQSQLQPPFHRLHLTSHSKCGLSLEHTLCSHAHMDVDLPSVLVHCQRPVPTLTASACSSTDTLRLSSLETTLAPRLSWRVPTSGHPNLAQCPSSAPRHRRPSLHSSEGSEVSGKSVLVVKELRLDLPLLPPHP